MWYFLAVEGSFDPGRVKSSELSKEAMRLGCFHAECGLFCLSAYLNSTTAQSLETLLHVLFLTRLSIRYLVLVPHPLQLWKMI